MSLSRKFSSLPLHPHFQAVLPHALAAAFDGAPGLIALDPRGGLALGRLRLRPADDRNLRIDLADLARLGGVGAVRLSGGNVVIPDLDGTFGRALPYADRQAAAQAMALARATLLLPGAADALSRAEMRRRQGLTRRVARTVRLAAPEASGALKTLDCQLELACHLHEMPAGVASLLPRRLADRREMIDLGSVPFDRQGLRVLARRQSADWPIRIDWAARDARLDRFLDELGTPRALARGA